MSVILNASESVRGAMNPDRIFYGTWGLVILMIGICVILGKLFSLDVLGIFTLWVLSVGAILVIVGIITINTSKKTATMQMGAGMLLVVISAGAMAILLKLLDVYITLAIIIIFVGAGIASLGLSKKR